MPDGEWVSVENIAELRACQKSVGKGFWTIEITFKTAPRAVSYEFYGEFKTREECQAFLDESMLEAAGKKSV